MYIIINRVLEKYHESVVVLPRVPKARMSLLSVVVLPRVPKARVAIRQQTRDISSTWLIGILGLKFSWRIVTDL